MAFNSFQLRNDDFLHQVKLGAKFKILKPQGGGGGAFQSAIDPKPGMWLVSIQGKLVA